MAIKTIARTLGASRNSVRRWLRAGAFVPYRRAPAPSRLDAHLRFFEVRWQDGQHNAAGLYRELRAFGFDGVSVSRPGCPRPEFLRHAASRGG